MRVTFRPVGELPRLPSPPAPSPVSTTTLTCADLCVRTRRSARVRLVGQRGLALPGCRLRRFGSLAR
jgi:hypothetical protein